LPKVEDPPGGFLRLQTWVDLRSDLADPTQLHVLLTGICGHAPADGSSLREALCPYRGLLSFREEDAGLFCGREEAIDTLLGKLRDHNLVTLVGRSGSGKSSVVSAGLIPALRRRADGRTWSILSLRPGSEPLHALVRRFDPSPIDLPPFEVDHRVEQQVTILRTDDHALGRRIRGLLATVEEAGTDRLLLHIDQCEELYTQALRNPALEPELAERDVTQFINLLIEATRTSPCTVVLTVRADFYGEFLKHGPLAAAVPPGQVNLGPLRREGLAAAIRKPAEAVGLTVDPPLLETLVHEVCSDLGKLPLLEYALKETWRRREGQRLTLNAYGEAGGIDGAVAQRANQIFTSLSQAQQAAACRLFVSLVTPGEGREDTRARAVYPEQDDAIAAVIDKFSAADARLLVTGEDAPSARHLVELSHEAIIREWGTLKNWVETNRETLRRREHIRARLRQWEEQGRDPTLLLPPGLPLEEGRKLLADHGDVLIDEVQPYIAASLAADEERRRQAEAAAEAERQRELAAAQRLASEQRKRAHVAIGLSLVALLLTAVAGWQWLEANDERSRAERYAEHAIDITQGFVRDAAQLSDSFGVPRSAIEVLLKRADTAFEQLMEEGTTPQLRSALAWQLMASADNYGIIGKSEQQRDRAKRARDILQALVDDHPSNPEWRRQLAIGHDLLGEILANQMRLDTALAEYRAAQSIREKLSTDDPSDPKLRRDLSISQQQLGGILLRQGHLDEALTAFQKALDISEPLARDDPTNLDKQRDVLVIDHYIGDVLAKQGDLNGAGVVYETSLSIAERLAADDPSNVQRPLDVLTSYRKIGTVREDQGDMDAALHAYRASLSIAKRLAADDPAEVPIQRDLSLNYENVGRILLKQRRIDAALDAYRASLAIAERLAAADPADASLQQDLSIRLNESGDALKLQGDLQAALEHYRRSLEIRKRLAADNLSNTELQRGVLEGHDRIGELLNRRGQVQEAIAEYQASHVIAKRLVAAEPTNADWQYLSRRQLGRARELERNKEEARDMYCQAKKVVMTNSTLHPADTRWQERLHWLEQHLNDVQGSGACPV
jgi:tetratricopeptide (TPR) repeat protein